MSPVKSLHDQLVCSSNKLQVVCVVELLGYVLFNPDECKSLIFLHFNKIMMNEYKYGDILVQMYTQHLWERYPNHIDHRGQTIKDHTWIPHEELLELDRNYECYQEFLWMATIHHEDKRFPTQPGEVGNQ